MKNNVRFHELDLFRFLAAFAVMLYHYCFRGYHGDDMSILSFAPFDAVAQYGFLGVELFFMISGFVILFTAQGSSPTKFTISRITRLYPAFWVCMTITAITTVFIGAERYEVSLTQYLFNLSLISSAFGVEDIDGVYWTIMIEIKFYLMIFLLLYFGCIDKIKYFLAAWLVASITSQLFTLPYAITFFLLQGSSPYFVAGACCYLIRKEGLDWLNILLLITSYFYALFVLDQHIVTLENHYNTEYNFMIVISIISVFFGLFILLAFNKLQVINKPFMLKLGVITYPLYLLHQNIGYEIFNLVGDTLPRWFTLITVIMLMIGISLLVHYKIEKVYGLKMKNLLTNFFNRKTPPIKN
jgi:peptidoglycan/LPS O-acetylase OafA/YrhL